MDTRLRRGLSYSHLQLSRRFVEGSTSTFSSSIICILWNETWKHLPSGTSSPPSPTTCRTSEAAPRKSQTRTGVQLQSSLLLQTRIAQNLASLGVPILTASIAPSGGDMLGTAPLRLAGGPVSSILPSVSSSSQYGQLSCKLLSLLCSFVGY
jgi:hypothetical protein